MSLFFSFSFSFSLCFSFSFSFSFSLFWFVISFKVFSLKDFSKNLSIFWFSLIISSSLLSIIFLLLFKILFFSITLLILFTLLFLFELVSLMLGKLPLSPFELLLFCKGFKGGIFFLGTTVVFSFSGDFLKIFFWFISAFFSKYIWWAISSISVLTSISPSTKFI